MLNPTYENLIGQLVEDMPSVHIALGSPSGNPRFYKFYWRVFSLESRLEGSAFLRRAPRLCNAAYVIEVERLLARGTSCLVYGLRRPRLDPDNPWDLTKAKWKGVKFAPSWDDDKDPIVTGGHK
jgi:hypothetical protein